jgi:hypothetical protein
MKLFLLLISILLCLNIRANNNADTTIIKAHLTAITKTKNPRNHKNIDELNRVANYIFNEFSPNADSLYLQPYFVEGKEYKNVVAVFGKNNTKTIVIGAHYDVCDNQEGADDNASGVVGLLEIARLLKGKELKHRIELVAYTLEEPPYFRTGYMGSHIHAKSLLESKREIYGMLCLEMIGYYDDRKKTQDYPLGILSLIYGNRGNYITLVNKFGKGKFARKFNREFKRKDYIKTKKFVAPKWLPGIDFSDHQNYWKYKISSVMITDTAFYRNKNYHEKSDKMETLNFEKMAQVINTTLEAILLLK